MRDDIIDSREHYHTYTKTEKTQKSFWMTSSSQSHHTDIKIPKDTQCPSGCGTIKLKDLI